MLVENTMAGQLCVERCGHTMLQDGMLTELPAQCRYLHPLNIRMIYGVLDAVHAAM
jgi:hypothetical protein